MLNPIQFAITLGSVSLEESGFGGTTGPDLTRYLVVVGILIVAIVGCSFLLRRVITGTHRLRAGHRDLQVLDVLPLGGKRQVSVVRCYDRTFALGLGERDVALIAELDPVATEPRKAAPGEELPERDFMRLFEVARKRLRRLPAHRPTRASVPTRTQAKPEEVGA